MAHTTYVILLERKQTSETQYRVTASGSLRDMRNLGGSAHDDAVADWPKRSWKRGEYQEEIQMRNVVGNLDAGVIVDLIYRPSIVLRLD